jgi:hypothetical protein
VNELSFNMGGSSCTTVAAKEIECGNLTGGKQRPREHRTEGADTQVTGCSARSISVVKRNQKEKRTQLESRTAMTESAREETGGETL